MNSRCSSRSSSRSISRPAVDVAELRREQRGDALPVAGVPRGVGSLEGPRRRVRDPRRRRRGRELGEARARRVELVEVVACRARGSARPASSAARRRRGSRRRRPRACPLQRRDAERAPLVESEHVVDAQHGVGRRARPGRDARQRTRRPSGTSTTAERTVVLRDEVRGEAGARMPSQSRRRPRARGAAASLACARRGRPRRRRSARRARRRRRRGRRGRSDASDAAARSSSTSIRPRHSNSARPPSRWPRPSSAPAESASRSPRVASSSACDTPTGVEEEPQAARRSASPVQLEYAPCERRSSMHADVRRVAGATSASQSRALHRAVELAPTARHRRVREARRRRSARQLVEARERLGLAVEVEHLEPRQRGRRLRRRQSRGTAVSKAPPLARSRAGAGPAHEQRVGLAERGCRRCACVDVVGELEPGARSAARTPPPPARTRSPGSGGRRPRWRVRAPSA